MSPLGKSIAAVVGYYDVLNRPLTGWEVFRYLIRRPAMGLKRNEISFAHVLAALQSAELDEYIQEKRGFYFLHGRSDLVEKRIDRGKTAEVKWKKARRLICLLQLVPFVRMAAVSGSLALNNVRRESDVDLLMVVKTGRIWTARFFDFLLFSCLRRRRHGRVTKDRLCFNHYLTDKALHISAHSLYNAQTYAHLTPLWEENYLHFFRQWQGANRWLARYLAHTPFIQAGFLRRVKSNFLFKGWRKSLELCLSGRGGDILESFLKRVQTRRIRRTSTACQPGSRVVLNDRQLEFHPASPERGIVAGYNKRMRKLGFPELAREVDSGLSY